jgi:hypothetical protein
MLEKLKQLLSGKDVPEELNVLYAGARDEREALILLKEARRRDESRRRRAILDLDVLDRMEEQLLRDGKEETSEAKKLSLARRIKEIRWKIQEINHRVESIYNKRIRVFNEHVQSLETLLELGAEELPDRKEMEEAAIKASTMLEELDKTKELAEGIKRTSREPEPDAEEREILREFEAGADAEIEKSEPFLEPPPEKKKDEAPEPELE